MILVAVLVAAVLVAAVLVAAVVLVVVALAGSVAYAGLDALARHLGGG